MTLSETGESRVNGYLFVLERSLGTFLPRDVVRDAVREIESHVRERIAAADGAPNERAALERILGELGPPLRVAQAYSAERTIDEAVATGRIVPVVRAVWQLAASTRPGILRRARAARRLQRRARVSRDRRAQADLPAERRADDPRRRAGRARRAVSRSRPTRWSSAATGSFPSPLAVGLAILVGTHRGARRFLARWRERRALASLRPIRSMMERPTTPGGSLMIRSLLVAAAVAVMAASPGARPAGHERRDRQRQELRAPRDDRRVRRRDEDRRDPRVEEDGLQGDLQLAALD